MANELPLKISVGLSSYWHQTFSVCEREDTDIGGATLVKEESKWRHPVWDGLLKVSSTHF